MAAVTSRGNPRGLTYQQGAAAPARAVNATGRGALRETHRNAPPGGRRPAPRPDGGGSEPPRPLPADGGGGGREPRRPPRRGDLVHVAQLVGDVLSDAARLAGGLSSYCSDCRKAQYAARKRGA